MHYTPMGPLQTRQPGKRTTILCQQGSLVAQSGGSNQGVGWAYLSRCFRHQVNARAAPQ